MTLTTNSQEMPVRIVGSSNYGRYPTVSAERTFNMFVTLSGDGQEECLVNFPGYESILALINSGEEGRGAFRSVRGGFIIAVVSASVFRVNQFSETPTFLGTIATSTGEVFFDENLNSQVCFVDGENAYIYNYVGAPAAIGLAVFDSHASDFKPNYVTYHNTYFIFGNALTTNDGSKWVIYTSGYVNPGDEYKLTWVQTLALQTKPDFAKAVLRIPGKGNNIIVFGETVSEIYNDVGGLLVYQRNASVNIDYGAASVATIAANDEVVAWLGVNEKSSPCLMAMRGGSADRISTDGLDHLLATVVDPSRSTAVLYRQGGHLFYILSFFGLNDLFSVVYDFTTNKLYDLTDWNFTEFPARQMIYFGNETYFISFKDGAIYRISSELTMYDTFANAQGVLVNREYQIPRTRITDTFRIPNRPEKYKVKLFTFPFESGTSPDANITPTCFGYIITEDTEQIIYTEDDLPLLVEGGYCYTNIPRIDLTVSKNGGLTFSNAVSYFAKPTGDFLCQPRFNNLGYAQQIAYQLRIWSSGRVVIRNGAHEIGT